jgi:hypothetical protein
VVVQQSGFQELTNSGQEQAVATPFAGSDRSDRFIVAGECRLSRQRLGMLAILAVQVREQEHQRQRERPDKGSNPRPNPEAASPTLGNSTGKIDRTDKKHQCDDVHDARSYAALR